MITKTVTDGQLTDELRKAGASEEFIRVLRFDENKVHATRNSIRQEVAKQVDSFGADPSDVPVVPSGHFFSALWDGDVEEAVIRADGSNARIIEAVFGLTRDDVL